MKIKLLAIAAVFYMLLGSASYSEEGSVEVMFQKGNTAVLDGRYQEASDWYQKSLDRWENGILHHNIGIVSYLNGSTGEAVLHLERARILGGKRAQTREVLSLIRKSNNLNRFEPTTLERLASVLPEWLWMMMILLSFWGFVFFGLYLYWLKGGISVFRDIAVGCVLILTVCICATLGLNRRSELGVFVGEENGLQITPVFGESKFQQLAAGEMGRLIQKNDRFVLVETSKSIIGWTEASNFKLIRE